MAPADGRRKYPFTPPAPIGTVTSEPIVLRPSAATSGERSATGSAALSDREKPLRLQAASRRRRPRRPLNLLHGRSGVAAFEREVGRQSTMAVNNTSTPKPDHAASVWASSGEAKIWLPAWVGQYSVIGLRQESAGPGPPRGARRAGRRCWRCRPAVLRTRVPMAVREQADDGEVEAGADHRPQDVGGAEAWCAGRWSR